MEKDEVPADEAARGPLSAERSDHLPSGAPTDEAHREVGDGALLGSIPAGLTIEELRQIAESDQTVEPGTG